VNSSFPFTDLKQKEHGIDINGLFSHIESNLGSAIGEKDFFKFICYVMTSLNDGHSYMELPPTAFSKPLYLVPLEFVPDTKGNFLISAMKPGVFDQTQIRPGWKVVAINGMQVKDILDKYRRIFSASTEAQFQANAAMNLGYWHYLFPQPTKDDFVLVVQSPDGVTVELQVPWVIKTPKGPRNSVSSWNINHARNLNIQGKMPLQARIFDQINLGYLKVYEFQGYEDKAHLDRAFEALKNTSGLIVDMRGNIGGQVGLGLMLADYLLADSQHDPNSTGYISHFTPRVFFEDVAKGRLTLQQVEMAYESFDRLKKLVKKALNKELTKEMLTLDSKGNIINFILKRNFTESAKYHYDKPVWILTDGACYSTTDVFLTWMKKANRAKIIGSPNGAGYGHPVPFQLTNSGFKGYLTGGYFYVPDMKFSEGHSFTPDLLITPEGRDMLAGRDTALIVSIAQYLKQTGQPIKNVPRNASSSKSQYGAKRQPLWETGPVMLMKNK
jgi:hypothetical protein